MNNSEIPTQVCNDCNEELMIQEFGYSASRGVHTKKCLKCTKKRRKPWYKADPNLNCHPWKKKKFKEA